MTKFLSFMKSLGVVRIFNTKIMNCRLGGQLYENSYKRMASRVKPNQFCLQNGHDNIDGFHSRNLQSCGTQMTKVVTAMLVHITKEVV